MAYSWHIFVVDSVSPKMSWIHDTDALLLVVMLVELTTKRAGLKEAVRFAREFADRRSFPTLRHGADLGLLLPFAADTFGEKFVHQ